MKWFLKKWISRELWLIGFAALAVAIVIGASTVLKPIMVALVLCIIFFPILFILPVEKVLILIALFILIGFVLFLSVGGWYLAAFYQVLFLVMSLKFVLEMVFQQRKIYKTHYFLYV